MNRSALLDAMEILVTAQKELVAVDPYGGEEREAFEHLQSAFEYIEGALFGRGERP